MRDGSRFHLMKGKMIKDKHCTLKDLKSMSYCLAHITMMQDENTKSLQDYQSFCLIVIKASAKSMIAIDIEI